MFLELKSPHRCAGFFAEKNNKTSINKANPINETQPKNTSYWQF